MKAAKVRLAVHASAEPFSRARTMRLLAPMSVSAFGPVMTAQRWSSAPAARRVEAMR